MKTTAQIRKELKSLIRWKKRTAKTNAEKNKAVNDARMEINKKYGNDWRGRELTVTTRVDVSPDIYDDHENGEHWMD